AGGLAVSVTEMTPARAAAPAESAVDDLGIALLALPRASATGRVVAVIPAYNEEASIALALDSLAAQDRRPDLIVVVGDNCTDGTAEVVNARGDAVMVSSVANPHKKAGALNQVLDRILPLLEDDDGLLVMDADPAPHARSV